MTNDDKALVEKLRARVSNTEIFLVNPPRPAPDRDCHYAADRIEALIAENERLREALELADAALRGANMNMNVVERKVHEALGETK